MKATNKYDENGKVWLVAENGEYIYDENGNRVVGTRSRTTSKEGEFRVYDTSQGHCGLCGRIDCKGYCFK